MSSSSNSDFNYLNHKDIRRANPLQFRLNLNKRYKVNIEEHFVSIVDGCFIRGLSSPE